MADVATRFKKFLEADTAGVAAKAGPRIHLDHVPQKAEDRKQPYVWFRRRLTNPTPTLDSAAGEQPNEFHFDLECIATTNREVQLLAEAVRSRCHLYRGAFDDSTCQGIFANDQDDDYLPNGIGDDMGKFVVAFGIQVFV